MPHVFLSHSGDDKDFVHEMYRRLTRDRVDCFFDIESIGWGTNWVKALERAIDECGWIVFVLSPAFCNSEWAELERTSNIADDPAGLKRKVLPLMLRPCRHLPAFPRFLRHVQTLDVSESALFEANYTRICRELGGFVRPDFETLDRTKLPPVDRLLVRHRMPYPPVGDRFVGRADSFWQLYEALHQSSTAILQGVGVLAGTGGLGKSQLAIEYVHRVGQASPGGVYWIDGDRGLGTLIAELSESAGIVLDPKVSESSQIEQV